MLTQKDIVEIEQIVRTVVKEEIRFIPSKDEFFKRMDDVMGELKAAREERDIIGGRVSQRIFI